MHPRCLAAIRETAEAMAADTYCDGLDIDVDPPGPSRTVTVTGYASDELQWRIRLTKHRTGVCTNDQLEGSFLTPARALRACS